MILTPGIKSLTDEASIAETNGNDRTNTNSTISLKH